jgi:hypothetical protein
MVKYDDVTVQLTGQDGNAFNIIGLVSKALKQAGHPTDEWTEAAFDCGSYDALLVLAMETVHVQ